METRRNSACAKHRRFTHTIPNIYLNIHILPIPPQTQRKQRLERIHKKSLFHLRLFIYRCSNNYDLNTKSALEHRDDNRVQKSRNSNLPVIHERRDCRHSEIIKNLSKLENFSL